jgi:putative oxidoreductase
MHARRQELTASIGLLILRLGIGGYLLTHGLGKVRMLLAGNFEQMGDPIGLGPVLSLILVTLAEFLGALLVMLGLGTRLAAALVVVSMSVAAFVAHGSDPWTMERGYVLFTTGQSKSWASKEPALLYLIPVLALVFTGAGAFSLDRLFGRRWRERRGRQAMATNAKGL